MNEMYRWPKGLTEWVSNDVKYISVPFTWLLDKAHESIAGWPGETVIGGPALMYPNDCPGWDPLFIVNPLAMFTTRGCPNNCSFCAVPKLEGDLREISDFRPAPLICDNNLLAASKKHIRKVVDSLKQFKFVDFNQGLEARRFTTEIAGWFGELRCKVRFGFDHIGQDAVVKQAIDLCHQQSTKDVGVYCLIGYNDTPEEAMARLELVRSWGVLPNPMRYQPLDARKKNEYVHPSWTERQLADVMRYYSRLVWLGHIPFSEYRGRKFDGD